MNKNCALPLWVLAAASSCAPSYRVKLRASEADYGLSSIAVDVLFVKQADKLQKHLAALAKERKIHAFFSDGNELRKELVKEGMLRECDVTPGKGMPVELPATVGDGTTIVVVANFSVDPDDRSSSYLPYATKRIQDGLNAYEFRLRPGVIEFVPAGKRP
ncbi:MAG: hypothetical protein ACE5F1_12455 [Planctomycetota bacterium]